MNEDTHMTIRITAIVHLPSRASPPAPARPKSATEEDFGNSMASLIKAQTADPSASSNPSTEPVTGVDPDYADNVIEAMRESVSKPAEVKQPIEIRVGGAGRDLTMNPFGERQRGIVAVMVADRPAGAAGDGRTSRSTAAT